MKVKLVGLVGYSQKEVKLFKKKYKKLNFIIINDKNFFEKKTLQINALVVLYEYPIKNTLTIFIKKNFHLFKNLEWLHLTRAGIDDCLPFIKKYNFTFTAGKKIQAPNVSDHCIAILLSLTRSLFSIYEGLNYLRPTEIKGKKSLIVGFGGIGKEIAKKLKSFGSQVYSVNDSKVNKNYSLKNFSLKNVKKIIKNFDIIINCLPLTSTTKNFYNKSIFNRMKKKSIFISVSRDQTINIKDLKIFLKKGKFLGVGIDNTGSFLMKKKIIYEKRNNFILTDHQAGITTNLSRRKELIEKNLYSFYKNKKLRYLVSKKLEY